MSGVQGDRLAYALAEEKHEAIFRRRVVPEYFEDRGPLPAIPTAVILGGQPGAGKSNALALERERLERQGATVTINGDDFRAYHPEYAALQRNDPERAAFFTDRDSGRWVEKTIAEAQRRGVNLVIESTMRDPQTFERTSTALKAAGYRVEAHAVATAAAESWQGVALRYEEMQARGGVGRWTLREAHDAGYAGVPQTLQRIESERLADRVTISTRSGDVRYGNELVDGQWRRTPQAEAALESERQRPRSAEEQRVYDATWRRIGAMQRHRGMAEAESVAAVEAAPILPGREPLATRVPVLEQRMDPVLERRLAQATAFIANAVPVQAAERASIIELTMDRSLTPAERVEIGRRTHQMMVDRMGALNGSFRPVHERLVMPEVERVQREAAADAQRERVRLVALDAELQRVGLAGPERPGLAERLAERVGLGRDADQRQREFDQKLRELQQERDRAARALETAESVMTAKVVGQGPITEAEQRAYDRIAARESQFPSIGDAAASKDLGQVRQQLATMASDVKISGQFVDRMEANQQSADRLRSIGQARGQEKAQDRDGGIER